MARLVSAALARGGLHLKRHPPRASPESSEASLPRLKGDPQRGDVSCSSRAESGELFYLANPVEHGLSMDVQGLGRSLPRTVMLEKAGERGHEFVALGPGAAEHPLQHAAHEGLGFSRCPRTESRCSFGVSN